MTTEEMELIYQQALYLMEKPNGQPSEDELYLAANQFESIKGYKDSNDRYRNCIDMATSLASQTVYTKAVALMRKKNATIEDLTEAANLFGSIDWGDSKEKKAEAESKIRKQSEPKHSSGIIKWIIPLIVISLVIGLVLYRVNKKNVETADVPFDSSFVVGKKPSNIQDRLEKAGFTDIESKPTNDKSGADIKPGEVISVTIDGDDSYEKGDEYDTDDEIVIVYWKK